MNAVIVRDEAGVDEARKEKIYDLVILSPESDEIVVYPLVKRPEDILHKMLWGAMQSGCGKVSIVQRYPEQKFTIFLPKQDAIALLKKIIPGITFEVIDGPIRTFSSGHRSLPICFSCRDDCKSCFA